MRRLKNTLKETLLFNGEIDDAAYSADRCSRSAVFLCRASSTARTELRRRCHRYHDTAFSTATFSLFIIAAAIGVLTLVLSLYGREWIQNQIEQKVEEKAETERRNIGGYIMAHFGFVFGSLYREHENDFPQFLDNAIELSYLAKETLNEEHPSYKIAENNFAFYAALRGKARHAPECVRIGNRLRAPANAPPDKEDILTYLQIVVRFSDYFESPDRAIRDACRLARQLLEEQDASEGQRQKAEERLNELLEI